MPLKGTQRATLFGAVHPMGLHERSYGRAQPTPQRRSMTAITVRDIGGPITGRRHLVFYMLGAYYTHVVQ